MSKPNLFHAVLRAEMKLSASADRVFPLLCPVREAEWLPGWKAELIHSCSGFAELGCVFRTRDEDGRERVWTISRHDPEAGIIQFVQFMKDLCVIRLEIALHTEGPSTRAEWTYSVAALEAGHDNFFTLYEDEPFRGRMTRLEGLLNRYLDTNPGH